MCLSSLNSSGAEHWELQQQSLIYMEYCDREMSHLERCFASLINFVAACQQIKKPALQEVSAVRKQSLVPGDSLWSPHGGGALAQASAVT